MTKPTTKPGRQKPPPVTTARRAYLAWAALRFDNAQHITIQLQGVEART